MANPTETRIALGLGANLGSPTEAITQALRLLEEGAVRHLCRAPLYRTAPVDCEPGTPPFINTAATGLWAGTPTELLRLCKSIEVRLGRPARHSQREARAIDIDILLFGSKVTSDPPLRLPHPQLTQRLFVLVPLADLAPDWPVPPTRRTVASWRDQLLAEAGAEAWGTPLYP